MRILLKTWWVLSVLLILVVAAVTVFAVHRSFYQERVRKMVEEYEKARVVVPLAGPSISRGSWEFVLELPKSTGVKVNATQTYEQLALRYSDETLDHEVIKAMDFVGVVDVRLSDDGCFLFVKTSGPVLSVYVSDLYKYSLCERHLVDRVSLK